MKKKVKNCLLGFALSAFVSVGATAALLPTQSGMKADAEVVWSKLEDESLLALKTNYDYGVAFETPSVKIEYNGQAYDATECTILQPNGVAVSKGQMELDQQGTYTLVYSVKVGDTTVKAEKAFTVRKDAYELSMETSSCEYVDEIGMVNGNAPSGLHVELADGDTFYYNRMIDLSKLDSKTPFIKIYPHNWAEAVTDGNGNVTWQNKYPADDAHEVSGVVITLTDAYNPDLSVEFVLKWTIRETLYYSVAANNQLRVGLHENTTGQVVSGVNKNITLDGIDYIARFSGTGTTSAKNRAIDTGYAWYYDNETTKARVKDTKEFFVGQLNNPIIFGNNLFEGFTTGEVYLSIKGEMYAKEVMNFEIESIGGLSGEALNVEKAQDETSPVINVDYRGGSKENIVIANGEPFSLFEATAQDVNLVGGVTTKVYYGYDEKTKTGSSVFVKDGKFTPNKVGTYSVVYAAQDSSGNRTEVVVDLRCVKTASGKIVDFSTTPIAKLEAGKVNVLSPYTLQGWNGKVDIEIVANYLDGTAEPVLIDAETLEFLPKQEGRYEIIYRYGDFVQNYEYAFETVSEGKGAALFVETPTLPNYFLSGASYSIDEAYVDVFNENGIERSLAKLEISQDGGAYAEISYANFTVSAKENVRFKFSHGGAVYETPVLTVVDGGFDGDITMEKYFYGDFTKKSGDESVSYTSLKTSGDNSLEFINVISLSSFALNFIIPENGAYYESVEIRLTDYYNENNKNVLRFLNKSGSLWVSANGAKEVMVEEPFTGLKRIWYSGEAFHFVSGASVEALPFTADRAFLEICLIGLTGAGMIEVKTLNKQAFSNDNMDFGKPSVYVANPTEGLRGINERIVLDAAVATDVLSPVLNESVTIEVKLPNGEYATSDDGVLLDGVSSLANRSYPLTLTEYGVYSVNYNVADQNGQKISSPYSINVQEKIPPTIKLAKGYDENTVVNVKVHSRIKVASYKVSDNLTAPSNLKVGITVLAPNMQVMLLSDGEFEVHSVGDYTVYYYCYDEAGNYATRYYTIRVA